MKIKTRYRDYPDNVPKKLFKVLKYWGFNRSLAASALGVNSGYLSNLLNKGVEPTDKTRHGRDVRRKLFLKAYKSKIVIAREKQPEYIRAWRKLSKEERHNVIETYIRYKNQSK